MFRDYHARKSRGWLPELRKVLQQFFRLGDFWSPVQPTVGPSSMRYYIMESVAYIKFLFKSCLYACTVIKQGMIEWVLQYEQWVKKKLRGRVHGYKMVRCVWPWGSDLDLILWKCSTLKIFARFGVIFFFFFCICCFLH
jgi:hypothetical protein